MGTAQNAQAQRFGSVGPHLLVYKTKADYSKLVPVILSEDRSKIISYPDPHDIKMAGSKLLPTPLHKGYLLDNRGVGPTTVFIDMAWDKYAALPAAPSASELFNMIRDKDPITVLCDCGKKSAFKHPEAEINKLIDRKKLLKTCTVIKNSR